MDTYEVHLRRALGASRKEIGEILGPHQRTSVRHRHRPELGFADKRRHGLLPRRDGLVDRHVGLTFEIGLVEGEEVLRAAIEGGLDVRGPGRTGVGAPPTHVTVSVTFRPENGKRASNMALSQGGDSQLQDATQRAGAREKTHSIGTYSTPLFNVPLGV